MCSLSCACSPHPISLKYKDKIVSVTPKAVEEAAPDTDEEAPPQEEPSQGERVEASKSRPGADRAEDNPNWIAYGTIHIRPAPGIKRYAIYNGKGEEVVKRDFGKCQQYSKSLDCVSRNFPYGTYRVEFEPDTPSIYIFPEVVKLASRHISITPLSTKLEEGTFLLRVGSNRPDAQYAIDHAEGGRIREASFGECDKNQSGHFVCEPEALPPGDYEVVFGDDKGTEVTRIPVIVTKKGETVIYDYPGP